MAAMAAAEGSALALVSTPAAALAGERAVLEHALCLVKRGRLTLDTLADANVLPVHMPPKPAFEVARSDFGGLLFVEWIDPRTRSVGADALSLAGSQPFARSTPASAQADRPGTHRSAGCRAPHSR